MTYIFHCSLKVRGKDLGSHGAQEEDRVPTPRLLDTDWLMAVAHFAWMSVKLL